MIPCSMSKVLTLVYLAYPFKDLYPSFLPVLYHFYFIFLECSLLNYWKKVVISFLTTSIFSYQVFWNTIPFPLTNSAAQVVCSLLTQTRSCIPSRFFVYHAYSILSETTLCGKKFTNRFFVKKGHQFSEIMSQSKIFISKYY